MPDIANDASRLRRPTPSVGVQMIFECVEDERVDAVRTTRADLRSDGPPQDAPDAWASRPVLAWLLRGAVLGLPIAAAVGSSFMIESEVSRPVGWAQVWWWASTLVVSALTAIVVERGVRRLTPLATLLRLTLVFPDRAPSRFKIARAAANPTRLAELAEAGVDERSNAAAQVLALLAQLGRHDRLTRGHSERVRVFADLIAEEMDIVGLNREKLRWAALIHDIGKISVPAAVLNKKGRPDPLEWAQIQGHPEAGEIYAQALFPWLGSWAGAITEHHERWDGTGYPRRLAGGALTLGGRIVAVADAYETMTAARSYKRPLSVTAARGELTACAGHQFDPDVVRAFLLVGVGRLSKALGPLSWLAHLPFITHVRAVGSRIATGAAAASPAAALGVGGLAAAAATLAGIVPAAADTRPAPPVVSAGHAGPPQTSVPQPRETHVAATPSPAATATAVARRARPVRQPDRPTLPPTTSSVVSQRPTAGLSTHRATATSVPSGFRKAAPPTRPATTPAARPTPRRTTTAATTPSPTLPVPASDATAAGQIPPPVAPTVSTTTSAPAALTPPPADPPGKGKEKGKQDKGKHNGKDNGDGNG